MGDINLDLDNIASNLAITTITNLLEKLARKVLSSSNYIVIQETINELEIELNENQLFAERISPIIDSLKALTDSTESVNINSQELIGLINDISEQLYSFLLSFQHVTESRHTEVTDRLERLIHMQIAPISVSEKDKQFQVEQYLNDVIAHTGKIDIRGIYSTHGASRRAIAPFHIEKHYIPLKTLIEDIDEDMDADQNIHHERIKDWRLPLTKLFKKKHLLVTGQPGSGKTTFLRLIANILAKDNLQKNHKLRNHILGLPLEKPAPFPILIRLPALEREMAEAEVNSGGSWLLFSKALDNLFGSLMSMILQNKLDAGECFILFDGLDEISDWNTRFSVIDILRGIMTRWRNNTIIITSRPFGIGDIKDDETIVQAEICSFSKEEISDFLDRWTSALFPGIDNINNKYLAELREAIFRNESVLELAKNPVMLTSLCVIHWNEQRYMPKGKTDLLKAILHWLLNSRQEVRNKKGFSNSFAFESFKSIALLMTSDTKGKKNSIDIASAVENLHIPFRDELGIVDTDLSRRKGIEFLENEMLDSGIIIKTSDSEIKFWHMLFQEYFAAEALAGMSEDIESGWWKHLKSNLFNHQWDEVIDNFVVCLNAAGRRRIHLFLERVLAEYQHDIGTTLKTVAVIGRILRLLEIIEYNPPPYLGWAELLERAQIVFSNELEDRVGIETKIAVADVIGYYGDPRIKYVPDMLPLHSNKNIFLGKYPVVVKQFQKFIEDGGYANEQYWKEGWHPAEFNIEKPRDWENQKRISNRPVVGLSWYEASAYCVWLSQKTGKKYRIQRSCEWEEAATNHFGRFPWGNLAPSPELANYNSNVGHPTPVGIYLKGSGAWGHMDLSGNVFEWCKDASEDGEGRILRGGSWASNNISYLRSANRKYWDYPTDRNKFLYGFRCAYEE